MASSRVYQLIYPRHREQIFWADFIQIHEVYIDSPLPTFILYHYLIGQPLRVKDFLDSPYFFKLYHLVPNSINMLF